MAIQTINIGNRVNDGLGDDLRTAFEKVNANFTELSNQLTVEGENAAETGVGIYRGNEGGNLQFKNLVAGTKIALEEFDRTIVIKNTTDDAFTRFDTDSGTIDASVHDQITFQGRFAPGSYTKQKDIEVTATGSSILFKTQLPITEILSNYDFGPIVGNFENSIQLALASANVDFGTVPYPSTVSLDCGTIL
jgi:hypothetical protein